MADHFGCDILHLTENGSKLYKDYYAKSILDNIIMDRCFFSELIYSYTFNRPSKVKVADIEKLLDLYQTNDWQLIILTADNNRISEQLNKRNDEDEEKVKKSADINSNYVEFGAFYKLPIVNICETTVNEIIKNLEEEKYGIRSNG